MGKLRVLSGRDVCEILTDNGFVHVRHGKGDYEVYRRQIAGTTCTVPVPMHRELAIGTLVSIIRQSNLPRSLFEAS